MKCDVIAEGVVAATKEVRLGVGARGPHHHNHHNYHDHHNPPTTPQVGLKIPLIVRLEGTNVEEGKRIMADSGMTIITADDLDDAAMKAVASIN